MDSIGERLREERERLGFNQTAFGAIGGVQKQAQLKYEKGERFPDASFLEAVSKVGADVQYIVTGQRSAQALTGDEEQLLTLFRAAPLAVKASALAGLAAGSNPGGTTQNFHAPITGGVAGRDIVNKAGKNSK